MHDAMAAMARNDVQHNNNCNYFNQLANIAAISTILTREMPEPYRYMSA